MPDIGARPHSALSELVVLFKGERSSNTIASSRLSEAGKPNSTGGNETNEPHLLFPVAPAKETVRKMPLAGAYFFVIPGWSVGPGPEPMNTGDSRVGGGLCSWVPGSRAVPEPRNDEYFSFSYSLLRGHDEGKIGYQALSSNH
jgi:hypothetical protein